MPKLRRNSPKCISLDTETTGLDIHHGCRPFIVTTARMERGEVVNSWFTWDVDPVTREPKIPEEERAEVQAWLDQADEIVLQNAKFDYKALRSIGIVWDWAKIRDTILASHLLRSDQPNDLTTAALLFLGISVQPYETKLKEAVKEARTAASSLPWRVAIKGLPELPSAKGQLWSNDYWLPRAVAKHFQYKEDHPWHTICEEYANSDSAVTLLLHQEQQRLIAEEGFQAIYAERLKLLPIIAAMEWHGITVNRERLDSLYEQYTAESKASGERCEAIAKSYGVSLSLPKGSTNNSLRSFIFDTLGLKACKKSKKTGEPSLDKTVLEDWEAHLPTNRKPFKFISTLRGKRKRDTAISYLDSYRRFWLPVEGEDDWFRIFPSLNPVGTSTLRFSSDNPNEQNASKKEGFNLRYCFGPLPGREWWALDAANIELRIPAYVAQEEEMVSLFERPNDPPYFGSNHLLIFSILHPDKWDHDDPKGLLKAKEKYDSTWYSWTKNGNFAVQYGSVEQSGTADRAYHTPGAFRQIKKRFSKIHGPGGLNESLIAFAEEHGYIETIPDRSLGWKRGYPLRCPRTQWGKILPTVPLNYFTQGTAMQWMSRAMVRCQEYLDRLNGAHLGRNYRMIMQIHDEIIFDFPALGARNYPKVKRLQRLMEQGGQDIGVPTPVKIVYHPNNWAETSPIPTR